VSSIHKTRKLKRNSGEISTNEIDDDGTLDNDASTV